MAGGTTSEQYFSIATVGPDAFVRRDYGRDYSSRAVGNDTTPSHLATELAAFAFRLGAVKEGEAEAKRLAGLKCSALIIRCAGARYTDGNDDALAGYVLFGSARRTRAVFGRGDRGQAQIKEFLFDPAFKDMIRQDRLVSEALAKHGLQLPE